MSWPSRQKPGPICSPRPWTKAIQRSSGQLPSTRGPRVPGPPPAQGTAETSHEGSALQSHGGGAQPHIAP